MKKCLRCSTEMKSGYGLVISSVFAGVAVVKLADDPSAFVSKNIDKINADVCPNCGEVSLSIKKVDKIE